MQIASRFVSTSRFVSMVRQGALTCLAVKHPCAEALIALQGAQVLRFTPEGERPVLWLSEQASYQQAQSVRGGIPVCWPWFSDLKRNPDSVRQQYAQKELPSHGWARIVDWQLDHVVEAADGVTLTLSVSDDTTKNAIAPVNLRVSLEIFVGRTLKLTVRNESLADQPVAFSQALHTYFAISGIDSVQIEGLEGVPFIDTLQDWQRVTEIAPVHFTAEVDRIYQGNIGTVSLFDRGWQRRILLRASSSRSLVLWNPHIEKSRHLSQFADDAWRHMLCIETANAMDDIVVLKPGDHHLLHVEIEIEPASPDNA